MSSLGLCRIAMRPFVIALVGIVAFAGVSIWAFGKTGVPHPEVSKAVAIYRADLEAYQQATRLYEEKATAYWDDVNTKRKDRRAKRARGETIALTDYVLKQPPVYTGPPRPVVPPELAKNTKTPPKDKSKPEPVPVVADFLSNAKAHFNFVPDLPATEIDFKRGYARAAFAVGLGKEQIVRIFAFEAGGNGQYDVQAGLESPGPNKHAITTALGYNQLLATNTISLLANHGNEFIDALTRKSESASGARRQRLLDKVAVLRKMIAFALTVPNEWHEHDKLARTSKGLGVHTLNLDLDVGPLLQTQKLAVSIKFARMKGYSGPLLAHELEMMNLMGDGSGLDILMLPLAMREKVPTSNFFQRGGYERNPVVIRHNVASALLAATAARMDTLATLPGAKELEAAFEAEMNTTGSNRK
jgi:hypothetical protein